MDTVISSETIAEIDELVVRIAAHQTALKLTTAGFARRYADSIGSEKTWTLLKAGKWQGHCKPEVWLPKLKAFVDRLAGAASFDQTSFMAKLPFVVSMNQEFNRLMTSPRDRRCMIVLAPEGVGKSWWASSKMAEVNSGRYYVRLNHTWREKPMHLARAFAEKLGAPLKKNPAAQVDEVIKLLKSLGEVTIIVDEGHLGGVMVFRLLKDLIDETSVRIVYLAFPTEFDAVRNSSVGAMAEARQLIRRSIRPIFDDYRSGVSPEDVAAYMIGRGLTKNAALEEFADKYAKVLATNQNLSTLADAVDEANEEAGDREIELTCEMVGRQIFALCSTQQERKAAKDAAKAKKGA